MDVQELQDEFPTYTLDENYLTKIRDMNPDAKALDIEAMSHSSGNALALQFVALPPFMSQ